MVSETQYSNTPVFRHSIPTHLVGGEPWAIAPLSRVAA
jgi:hypothetical protein